MGYFRSDSDVLPVTEYEVKGLTMNKHEVLLVDRVTGVQSTATLTPEAYQRVFDTINNQEDFKELPVDIQTVFDNYFVTTDDGLPVKMYKKPYRDGLKVIVEVYNRTIKRMHGGPVKILPDGRMAEAKAVKLQYHPVSVEAMLREYNVKVFYIGRTTYVVERKGGSMLLASSKCHKNDHFTKIVGVKKACERLEEGGGLLLPNIPLNYLKAFLVMFS